MRIVYLHGFGSGPESRKARFFSGKLAAAGITLMVPPLAPDFRNLTISSQLEVVDQCVEGEESVLIGSSLGGYLAALYAAQHPSVRRLLLLAPAFRFADLWQQRLGPDGMSRWQKEGTLPVFHYTAGQELPLGYQLMTDARRYPPEPDVAQPCLLFHGRADDVVPFRFSSEYSLRHANVRLCPFDSGHEMTDVLEPMWEQARDFLLPPEPHI